MCGRYADFLPAEAIARLFRTVNPLPNLAPSWNVAPTQEALVVRRHPDTGDRHLGLLKWGLVPAFKKAGTNELASWLRISAQKTCRKPSVRELRSSFLIRQGFPTGIQPLLGSERPTLQVGAQHPFPIISLILKPKFLMRTRRPVR
jgi:hypothetical protein